MHMVHPSDLADLYYALQLLVVFVSQVLFIASCSTPLRPSPCRLPATHVALNRHLWG